MPTSKETLNETLEERLARYREIKISVIGRKSGKRISLPVWFVFEAEKPKGGKLYMVPVQGSDSQWYKNLLHNPLIRIDARGAEAEFGATAVTNSKAVQSVVDKFREKYGAKDAKNYYSKFDVAISVQI